MKHPNAVRNDERANFVIFFFSNISFAIAKRILKRENWFMACASFGKLSSPEFSWQRFSSLLLWNRVECVAVATGVDCGSAGNHMH